MTAKISSTQLIWVGNEKAVKMMCYLNVYYLRMMYKEQPGGFAWMPKIQWSANNDVILLYNECNVFTSQ